MLRRCEVLEDNGGWRALPFEQLTPGMVFRLFEDDGTPVTEQEGRVRSWRVLEAPMVDAAGPAIWTEPIEETDIEYAVRTQGMFWPGGMHGHLR